MLKFVSFLKSFCPQIDHVPRNYMLVAGYLSLSSSHTTAFLRCLQHGCQCPDNEPPLDVPKSGPCWGLISKGWSWLVISHEVEAALPSLPAFLAMANNSTNSISAASNELECAMVLAHYHKCGIPDPHEGCHCQGQSWWHPMPRLLAACCHLCPEVCRWQPFSIAGIPFQVWYLSYINTFFISFHVWSNHKSYPPNFLSKKLFNQANSSMPLSWWART